MVTLPGQLFYSTQVPVCLGFLAKKQNYDIGCALEGGAWVVPHDADFTSTEVVGPEHSLVFLSMQLFNLLQALGTVPRMAIPTWLEAGGIVAANLGGSK